MSGSSFNYISSTLLNECEGRMEDIEMDELLIDFCKLLHVLEWWQSSDSSEENYRECVRIFKEKWFLGERNERLKGYVNKEIETLKTKLYRLIGEEE